jgi:hypothetical protein
MPFVCVIWVGLDIPPCFSIHLSHPDPLSLTIIILSALYKYKKQEMRGKDPRWLPECWSWQCELRKSKILLRRWSHTWQNKKHQEESKLWHPEPPACTKLLHATLHWENSRAPMPPDARSKLAWETSGRPIGDILVATPGINQHSLWTDWPPLSPAKKNQNWIINKDLKRNMQQRGRVL